MQGCRFATKNLPTFQVAKFPDLIGPLCVWVPRSETTNQPPATKNIQLKVHEKMDPSIFSEISKWRNRISSGFNVSFLCWECIRKHCCDIGRPRHAPGPRRNNLSLDRLKGNSWCSNLILGLRLLRRLHFVGNQGCGKLFSGLKHV